jgi:hypothetical protein
VPPKVADDQARLRSFLRQAPGDLARRLVVPVVNAAQAGEFEGLTPGNETVPYVSRFLGETQITDGHGNVLDGDAGRPGGVGGEVDTRQARTHGRGRSRITSDSEISPGGGGLVRDCPPWEKLFGNFLAGRERLW